MPDEFPDEPNGPAADPTGTDDPADDGDGDAEDPLRRALLAAASDQLLAPVHAIVELSEMLINDARELGHGEFVADLRKVNESGLRLGEMIRGLLEARTAGADPADFGRGFRHDLRAPLNHVIGYCELWMEDAQGPLLEGFLPDLRQIHESGRQLLERLDSIVRAGAGVGDLGVTVMVEEVFQSLPPRIEYAGETAPAETGTILVVDDVEANRDLLARGLLRQGHAVAVAEDGHQALRMIRQQDFDLVLLDLMMPGLNGFQVLEHLKEDDRLRDIPVVMISALDEVDSAVSCIEMGAEDYLTRPLKKVVLNARINACLEKKRLRDREVLYLREIERERRRSDELLHVIMPHAIVEELKATDAVKPKRYEDVAVLFADIVGFTPYCDRLEPEEVVAHLQGVVESWERSAVAHDLEKIKTIGDAFMGAAGLLRKVDNPVRSCVECGLEMIAAARGSGAGWDLRVGIHVGPVVAGVLGRRQFAFDLWGDTVNTAARMESHGVKGAINLSRQAWARIADRCLGRPNLVKVKGKEQDGPLEIFQFESFLA